MDLDISQGTVVLYAGQNAVFATLALGMPKNKLQRGLEVTSVAAKYVTDASLDPNSLDTDHERRLACGAASNDSSNRTDVLVR